LNAGIYYVILAQIGFFDLINLPPSQANLSREKNKIKKELKHDNNNRKMGQANSVYVTGELFIGLLDLSPKVFLGTSIQLRRPNVTAQPPGPGIVIDRSGPPPPHARIWCQMAMRDGCLAGVADLRHRGLARGVVLEVSVNRITGSMTAVRVVRIEEIPNAETYPMK
jgi:hypothetical protein